MKQTRYTILIFIAVLYLASLSSCKKNGDAPGPALPPSSSMDMEGLSNFTSKKKSTLVSDDSTNYKIAWRIVHKWDSIAIKFVLTPKIIFLEALSDKSPVYDDVNKIWTWTYTKNIAGDGNYQASLAATVDKDSVYWTMAVSRINGDGLFNFKWFEGHTDTKQTGGWWKLYDPVSKSAYLLLNWKKESDVVKWIQYTNIYETDPSKGSFIRYGITTATDYNAYFDINLISPNGTAKIEWNTSTFAGKIIYDGWAYSWDSSLKSLAATPTD
jgi:hypothetical protein